MLRRRAKWLRGVASPLSHADVHDVVVAVLDSSHNAPAEDRAAVQRKVTDGRVGELPL